MQLAWLLRKWMNHYHSSVVVHRASSCIFSTTSTWPKPWAEFSRWALCSQAQILHSPNLKPPHAVTASKSKQLLAEVGESTFAVTNTLTYGMNSFIWRMGQQAPESLVTLFCHAMHLRWLLETPLTLSVKMPLVLQLRIVKCYHSWLCR